MIEYIKSAIDRLKHSSSFKLFMSFLDLYEIIVLYYLFKMTVYNEFQTIQLSTVVSCTIGCVLKPLMGPEDVDWDELLEEARREIDDDTL